MSGEITALRLQRRRKDRVNVYIDGQYRFSLQSILAADLHHGQVLSDREIEDLQQRDGGELAYERALHYLSFRPRSAWEIRQYLQKRDVEGLVAEQVMARLQRVGLVDDEEFAKYWVENRETFRPRGRWALRAELRKKGVEAGTIERALVDLNEEAGALKAARSRLRILSRLDEKTFHRRLLGYLQRRGFDYGVSQRVVTRLWSELSVRRECDSEQ